MVLDQPFSADLDQEAAYLPQVLRRYLIQDREDYVKYSRIVGTITKLVARLKNLDSEDSFRISVTESLLHRLCSMGLVDTESSLAKAEKISVSAFCRRRLPVVMVRLKMSETLKEAITFIEQGQVRVGPNLVTDPSFLVTRTMEDFVTWADDSKIRRTIAKYQDRTDDFDLAGEG